MSEKPNHALTHRDRMICSGDPVPSGRAIDDVGTVGLRVISASERPELLVDRLRTSQGAMLDAALSPPASLAWPRSLRKLPAA
jgi:hypothetical protein